MLRNDVRSIRSWRNIFWMDIRNFDNRCFSPADILANKTNSEKMMKKIKIYVEGMHCASCAANIERSLKKTPGVKSATISLMTKKGFVDADERVSDEEIKKAVARAGYRVVNIEKE